jgi:hypothetical protein
VGVSIDYSSYWGIVALFTFGLPGEGKTGEEAQTQLSLFAAPLIRWLAL